MKFTKHTWYVFIYLLKHNIASILAGALYTTLLVVWNITTYTRGIYIRHGINDSMFNTFTDNISLLIMSIIIVMLYISDVSDKTITYIRMRPVSSFFYTISKTIAIWLIMSILILPIYLSDSLLIGKFSVGALCIVLLTILNIVVISAGIGSLISNKTSIFIIAGYSGLSTSLHGLMKDNTVAQWLAAISMLSPLYKEIPWAGILLFILMLIRESRRNIRA